MVGKFNFFDYILGFAELFDFYSGCVLFGSSIKFSLIILWWVSFVF